MEPMVFAAQPSGAVETVDAASLFERAGTAFGNKDFAAALALFDRVVRRLARLALRRPRRCTTPAWRSRASGDLAAAAARYSRITVEHADAKDAIDAWYRLGFVQSQAKSWPDAVDTYGQILQRKDLCLGDRIEALARRGVAQLNAGDILAAEHTFRDELAFYHAHESEERLDSDFFIAMGAYYLGECAHEQYRAPAGAPAREAAGARPRGQGAPAAGRPVALPRRHARQQRRVGDRGRLPDRLALPRVLRRPRGRTGPSALTGEARDVYLEEVRKQVRDPA